ncbi:MAG: HK97 gp10 family phage protein [Parcubacteria group bacterium]|nr:HK97 gp10 family phage protein [Parcubacteria group bacterium]
MATFEVKIENLPELRRAFRDYPKIAEPILQKAIIATQFIFQKHTLKDNPVPWRTGNLLQSFRFKFGRLQARWFPTAKYAPFVEFGTRPHAIFPRRALALAWEQGGSRGYKTASSGRRYYRSKAGNMVFAAHVNHPGTKARPFMGKIVKNSQNDVTKLFKQAGDMITREIAKRTNIS